MKGPRWLSQITHDKPGERFIRAYRRRQVEEKDRPWQKAAVISFALLLLVAGGILMVLPVVPGFMLALPGIAVLFGGTRKGAEWLDRTELWVRRVGRGLCRMKERFLNRGKS